MASMPESFQIIDKNGNTRKYTPRSYDKLVGVDPQIILDRIAKGELMRHIAEDYGCVVQTVSEYVKRNVDPETWAQVREHSIASRLEQSSHEIEQATDQLELARAREQARLWMWRAERELPHLYGQRTQITHEVGPDLGEMLRDARKRVAQSTHAALPTELIIDNDTQSPVQDTD